ncbi:MurR/RpiR family transcriptional regulator (plasmid) [Sinorhizobium garamanticum]|uniref:MurR/RpiR family transcriptional regulator n=1 Tax=Sinorhizobium garamanticum TaxID=680247 RepID=A0ABY8DKH1_9HYPH|nr:MurR/RpiR family transcriptional regulator [Sinorhizobium garamanticum]WEX91411.1 MurR/RpiR family transcriptional regulator [Sinorhizobium garamanticum]
MAIHGESMRTTSKDGETLTPVLLKVETALDYPNALARVAQYILENPKKAVRQSLGELSAASQSGQATIFRLCRELGFKGFTDFKLALAAEVGQRETEPNRSENLTVNSLDETVSLISRSVSNTRQLVQQEVLASAAPPLLSARHVNIYGSGDSGLAAEVLFHRLRRIGVNARIFVNVGYAHEAAEAMTADDAAIAVSQSGASPDTVEFLRKAHHIGAFSLAITCHPKSSLAKVANVVLQMARLPQPGLSEQMIALPRAVFIAEALAIAIADHAKAVTKSARATR